MNADNQVPRSAAGVQLGSDAVLQVQVFSSNYGAEYGRGSGGVMNSITRSGTTELQGTLFAFLRNSKLDAKNFFDPSDEPIPPFKRNQFGFMLTGPLWQDRTFFMASFEGLRDRLTETDTSFFPDKLARDGIITDQNGAVLEEIKVNPSVAPYLALYPIPNSGSVGGGKGVHKAPRFFPTDENFFTVRIDHKISDHDSLFGRYTFDDATSVTSGGPTFLFLKLNDSRQQYLTLVETHIVNPGLLNSFRFGYTRPLQRADVLSLIDIPRELFFVPDAPEFGEIEVPGLSTFGNFQSGPVARDMETLQFSDDVMAQKGAHALRFGFEVHRYNWDVFTSVRKGGNWSFNSLANFLQGGPQGTTLVVTLPGSDTRKLFRQTFAGFYGQDTYTITPDFQLSIGLRYEFATLIRDKDGKDSFLLDPVRDLELQIGPILANNPSLNSFAPRLGLTWSPWSRGGTVLSAGFGVYYDQLIEYFVDRIKNSPPFFNMAVRTNFDSFNVFPDAVAAAAGIPVCVQIPDYRNTDTPMVLRYNLELRQPLPGGWRLRASYVGARGNHLFRGYESNLFPVPITQSDGSLFFPDNCNDPLNKNPSALCRPDAGAVNPAFESVLFYGSDAQSFYNSLRLSGNRTFNRGFSLQASYTFSKSVDDASAHLFRTGQYGLNRTLDRGLSDFDTRHRLAINYFLALPFGNGQRWGNAGPLSRVIEGWRLGGILRLRSGTPFNTAVSVRTPGFLFAANRPNLLPGASNNPTEGVSAGCGSVEMGQKLGGPDLYFDPCDFAPPEAGTLGNVGRNTLISLRVFNMDVSLQRYFLLDSKRRLQFRVDLFNLTNHPSFAGNTRGSAIVFSGSGDSPRRNSTAGKITGTVTTARQIQFALRLSF